MLYPQMKRKYAENDKEIGLDDSFNTDFKLQNLVYTAKEELENLAIDLKVGPKVFIRDCLIMGIIQRSRI
jgi:hypothetical protein